ncbi:hypothetical protein DM860_001961 [Cuscuta australis]|uniref:Dof zinc finger protein n=1 Tax=Cuscuta australis TaxID=267555 RepID=A0A328DWT4_9ASTE|nr:hypothetical protein DM860_001961 [Cuscuta australis]
MVATSSTKNVWSHEVDDDDDGKSLMGSSGGISVMEKAAESGGGGDRKQPPPPQQALKCPRCDSSNTKFCYYNNYSLSQPRHFCKACKRYWTRGGTLRNVPVGGGCRKNKRVRRHPPPPPVLSSSVAANDQPPAAGTMPLSLHHQHQPQVPDHLVNPFLYRYPGSEPGFDSGFEHHQHNNMGLGFSFSGLLGSVENNPGFVNHPSPYLAFGSSSSCSSSASSLASLIASRLHYQGVSTNNGGGFHGGPYIENFGSGENLKEEVKREVENNNGGISNNTHFQMGNFNTSDKNNDDNDNNNNGNNNNPSSLSWTWFDPSNMGSSVPSIL